MQRCGEGNGMRGVIDDVVKTFGKAYEMSVCKTSLRDEVCCLSEVVLDGGGGVHLDEGDST